MAQQVSLKEFSRLVVRYPPRWERAIITGLRRSATRLNREVVRQIGIAKPYPAVDRGELKGSVRTTKKDRGAKVGVYAPHSRLIERGTRPFHPPLGPLADWALRKRIALDEVHAMVIARGIQKKFEREGMAPRFYFRKAIAIWRRGKFAQKEIKLAMLKSEQRSIKSIGARRARKG